MVQVLAGTDQYLADFKSFVEHEGSRAPGWLNELRQSAIVRLGELGFPNTRQEKWRFTSVKPIAEKVFQLAFPDVALSPAHVDRLAVPVANAPRVVFVNGAIALGLSTLTRLPRGVEVGSLGAAIGAGNEVVQRHLAKYASFTDNPFAALNTAFTSDGAFVHVAANTVVEQPLQLIFLSASVDSVTRTHPRNLVVIEPGATARIVEIYGGEGTYLTNPVTEVVVGDNGRADCYRIQRESETAYHVATTHSRQGRDSWYSLTPVVFGGALTRHDLWMGMHGEGGHGILNGLYVVHDGQHVDHQTVIDHAQAHCESHEYFNGILDDRARAVFNGRIIVRPGAQKTDSKQTNNNLLLSGNARADSQPQLEIYADDVKCTHGATLGPLDDAAMFYARSRGLDAGAARTLLTYGFGVEILDRIAIPELRDQLDRLVTERLDQSQHLRDAA